jgi:probable F420-dependent oxidoreductase
MKVGALVRNFGGYPETGRSARACIDFAREIERTGFDSIWVTDHIVLPRSREAAYPHNDSGWFPYEAADDIHDPLALLGALTQATSRAALGTAVLVIPYRHPLTTAKVLSTVDQLSPGRLILGAGVGWLRDEFEALGLSEEVYARRGGVTEEYLEVMRKAWTAAATFSHEGHFVRFGEVGAKPRPSAPGRPPVWIGGKGDQALKRAVRIGDGYFAISSDADLLAEEVRRLRAFAEAAGRDPASLTVALIGAISVSDQPLPKDRPVLRGSAEQILDDLQALARAGLDHLAAGIGRPEGLSYKASVEALEILAEKVLPHCAGLD